LIGNDKTSGQLQQRGIYGQRTGENPKKAGKPLMMQDSRKNGWLL